MKYIIECENYDLGVEGECTNFISNCGKETDCNKCSDFDSKTNECLTLNCLDCHNYEV